MIAPRPPTLGEEVIAPSLALPVTQQVHGERMAGTSVREAVVHVDDGWVAR
jgi:hypothetical protein